MKKVNLVYLIFAALMLLSLALVVFFTSLDENSTSTPSSVPDGDEPIACTMNAKMCSDGSYVGRSGPNCEFICPNE